MTETTLAAGDEARTATEETSAAAMDGRTRAAAKRRRPETPEFTAESTLLAMMQELRAMQAERTRFEETLRLRDVELLRLQNEISRSNNIPAIANTRETFEASGSERVPRNVSVSGDHGLKLKLDTFDGTVPLREFLSQFNLVARANNWSDAARSVALATSLRGKARSVLETLEDPENFDFSELKAKLESRFGETGSPQEYYTQFTGRRQRFGEDFSSYGAELERLARLAYPECSYEVRDKIACAQFVTGLSDFFLRRTLRIEGTISLKSAVERAKSLRTILKEESERGKGNFGQNRFSKKEESEAPKGESASEKAKVGPVRKGAWRGNRSAPPRGECWSCGKSGHFRSECPEAKMENAE